MPILIVVNGDNAIAASLPGMWERTITIGSGGKTFSATGWKVRRFDFPQFILPVICLFLWLHVTVSQVGWAISSGHIIKHMKTIHQNTVYHCATAAQVNATDSPSAWCLRHQICCFIDLCEKETQRTLVNRLHLWPVLVTKKKKNFFFLDHAVYIFLFCSPLSPGSSGSGLWARTWGVWFSGELLSAASCNAESQAGQAGLVSGQCRSEAHHARGRIFHDCRFLVSQ